MSLGAGRMRAIAHPLRLRMLSLLTGAPLSAAELARELGITHSLASYHLRRLADQDLVQLAETRTTNHATERRYRYLPGPESDSPLDSGDSDELPLLVEALAVEARRRAAYRDRATPTSFTDAELWLDPGQWGQARAELTALSTRLHAAAQPPHQPGTVRMHLSVLAFQLLDDAGAS